MTAPRTLLVVPSLAAFASLFCVFAPSAARAAGVAAPGAYLLRNHANRKAPDPFGLELQALAPGARFVVDDGANTDVRVMLFWDGGGTAVIEGTVKRKSDGSLWSVVYALGGVAAEPDGSGFTAASASGTLLHRSGPLAGPGAVALEGVVDPGGVAFTFRADGYGLGSDETTRVGRGAVRGEEPSGWLVRGFYCPSPDGTDNDHCLRYVVTDEELRVFLEGTAARPFAPPVVCGEPVESVDEVRFVLGGSGNRESECSKLKREILVAMFNLRRSELFGDGRLGENQVTCFTEHDFALVLRCGDELVPDPADPSAPLVLTEFATYREFVEAANAFCPISECPETEDEPCGRIVTRLRGLLSTVSDARTEDGSCPSCPGDVTPPAITCPAGPLVFECQGPNGAPVVYQVSAEDDCDPRPLVTCEPPSGTVLPLGMHEVECKAKDMHKNRATCELRVEVVDTTPPSIECPSAPLRVDCSRREDGGAIVDYPAPRPSDLCGPASVACDPPPGSVFPPGSTTVVCVATDAAGNTAACSFEVEVVEETPVELICPADVRRECTSQDGAVVDYDLPVVSATCEPPPVPRCEPPPGSLFPLASTTVLCTAEDESGRRIECRFTVAVEDTVPPTLVCPGELKVPCASPAGSVVEYTVRATDACDTEPVVECDPPSGTVFGRGRTTVTCTARDSSGNVSVCEFLVRVQDKTPPTITCPAGPIRVSCSEDGVPGAVVNYPAPVATDSCDSRLRVECDPPSGSVFPPGTTTVTCSTTDDGGNTARCSFDVEVAGGGPPMLACPDDVRVECTRPDGAIVDYAPPVAADSCGGDPVVVCEPPPGSLFPPGTTTVTCTAAVVGGSPAACAFRVTVEDSVPPIVVCPPDASVDCEGPGGARFEFTVSATDACDPAPRVECEPPSGSLFPRGTTAVRCAATDASGNESACTFVVGVVDATPPEVTCPAALRVECLDPGGTPVTFAASAVDLCEGMVAVTCEPTSGSLFPPGDTPVTCGAEDASGNRSECSFTVTVEDMTPPEITCSKDLVRVECDGGAIMYPEPVASDRCDPEPPLVVCDPPQGASLSPGRHTVTCVAADRSGNEASCSFDIEVVDTAPPMLTCIEDLTRECDGPEGAIVDYPPPVATDACDAAPRLVCLPAPGSVFPLGETTVTCSADDASGNLIQCTFAVRVADTVPPLIQCPGDLVVPCVGPAGTPVSYAVTAEDLCDPVPLVACVPPSGSKLPVGATVVTCTATDRAGNSAECTFTVTVTDVNPPRITCPADFETACIGESGMARVEYPPPAVADDCDPSPLVICDPPSGSLLPLGAHTITCSATDASGNRDVCELTITVVDTAPPKLVCPSERTAECESPAGAIVSYPLPIASDACDGPREVQCVPPPGSTFPLGDTEVTCASTDASGNSMQCSFLVRVADTTPPDITCPAPIVSECSSPEGAVVSFEAQAVDLCDPAPGLTCDPPSGSLFPSGMTMVTCTAADRAGNQAVCSFAVAVIDRTPPAVVCPADVTLECTTDGQPPHKPPGWPPGNNPPPNVCDALAEYAKPGATDGCDPGPIAVTCTPAPGTPLALGDHLVTCIARDAAGNTSSCSFTIHVVRGTSAFVRGDANGSANIDIGDAIKVFSHIYYGFSAPECLDAADSNDDGKYEMTDGLYVLRFQYMGGPRPPEPFLPLCGLDRTSDKLTCLRFRPCE